MELIKLVECPIAARMLGKGDVVFYQKEENAPYLKAEISECTSLKFGETLRYKIMFTENSNNYFSGDQEKVDRSKLSIEKKVADELSDVFMLLLD